MTADVENKIKEINKLIKKEETDGGKHVELTEKMMEVHKLIFNEKDPDTKKDLEGIVQKIYNVLPDKLEHPVYKNYFGYKNGRVLMKGGKISNTKPNSAGYICDKINGRNCVRHRFIVQCYLEKSIDSSLDVDHINSDKLNNNLYNLQVLTRNDHLSKTHKGKTNTSGTKKSKPVRRYKLDKNKNKYDVKEYLNTNEAQKDTGCGKSNITSCIYGRGITSGGYYWEFVKTEKDLEIEGEKWKKLCDINNPKLKNSKMEISNFGRIKSGSGVISFGYKSGSYLSANINGNAFGIHILVALAFIGNKPSINHSVDHINRNRKDNKLENLKWSSVEEQSVNKSTAKKINVYKNNTFVDQYESLAIAGKKLGLTQPYIGNRLKLNRKTAKGYRFKIATEKPFVVIDNDDTYTFSCVNSACKYFKLDKEKVIKCLENNTMYKGYSFERVK